MDKEALWLIESPTYLSKCTPPFLGHRYSFITRYSFIQLSELRQCGVNKITKALDTTARGFLVRGFEVLTTLPQTRQGHQWPGACLPVASLGPAWQLAPAEVVSFNSGPCVLVDLVFVFLPKGTFSEIHVCDVYCQFPFTRHYNHCISIL